MRCINCEQQAVSKCECQFRYMCQSHLNQHLSNFQNHQYYILSSKFNHKELDHLKAKLNKRLFIIKKAEEDLILKTNLLIRTIKNLLDESLRKLKKLFKIHLELSNQDLFSDREFLYSKEILEKNLEPKTIEIDRIQGQLEMIYKKSMFTQVENVSYGRIKFLDHHVGGFRCGVVTDDSKMLVTGGTDSVVRVWDLINKTQLYALQGHNSVVQCITLTSDSEYIVSGSLDATIRIWNFSSNGQFTLFKGHVCSVFTVCCVNISSLIISGDNSGQLLIWNYKSCEILNKITHKTCIYSLALDKSQKWFLLGSNYSIFIYKLEPFRKFKELKEHKGCIWSMFISRSLNRMVSGSSDKSVILWDLDTFKIVHILNGHESDVFSVIITQDNLRIISGSADKTIIIWNIKTFERVNLFGRNSSIYSILQLCKNTLYLTISEDSDISCLDHFNEIFQIDIYNFEPFMSESFNYMIDLGLIGYGSKNNAKIWDVNKESVNNTLLDHFHPVLFVEISMDGQYAVSCSKDIQKNLIYWNLNTSEKIKELKGHESSVNCACLFKSSMMLASGSNDKTIRIWNLNDCSLEYVLSGHNGAVISIKILENKSHMASAGDDKKIILWSISNNYKFKEIFLSKQVISKLLVTNDEKFIIICDLIHGIQTFSILNQRLENHFIKEEEAEKWLSSQRFDLELVKRYLKP